MLKQKVKASVFTPNEILWHYDKYEFLQKDLYLVKNSEQKMLDAVILCFFCLYPCIYRSADSGCLVSTPSSICVLPLTDIDETSRNFSLVELLAVNWWK